MKFSIRGILAITTAIGALLAVYVVPSAVAAAIILSLWPVAAAILLGVAIYARGALQAFATGAVIPVAILGTICGWMTVVASVDTSDLLTEVDEVLETFSISLRILLIYACVTALVCGLLCIGIRHVFRNQGEP